MTQSRTMSAVEAVANVLIGFWIAVLTQIAVFPVFGLKAAFSDHLAIGLVFTIVSLARGYLLRRLFNGLGE